jgi:hypothetical protein
MPTAVVPQSPLTGALVPLGDVIVPAGGLASIDFLNIPQQYAHLQLIVTGRSDAVAASTQILVRFNGDAGANYDDQRDYGTGSTAGADGQGPLTSMRLGYLIAASQAAGLVGSAVIDIPNYAGATFHKVAVVPGQYQTTSGPTGNVAEIFTGTWHNIAPITRITVFPGAGNFLAGSRATLYGIAATLPPQTGLGPIQDIIVPAGGLSSVDFLNIPQGYINLLLEASVRTNGASGNDQLVVRFNNDTANNYGFQLIRGSGTGAPTTTENLAINLIYLGQPAGAPAPAGAFDVSRMDILDYANPAKHKAAMTQFTTRGADTSGNYQAAIASGFWRSLTPINRITVATNSANLMVAGSRLTLYGR